jgi:L-ascorbate metabolism protein UlaG (beta-lactamase superfamily)
LLVRVPGPGRFLTGEMDADEAARTAEMLGVRIAVACHYLEIDAEARRFLELVPKYDSTGVREAVAPEVGDTLVVDRQGYELERAAA